PRHPPLSPTRRSSDLAIGSAPLRTVNPRQTKTRSRSHTQGRAGARSRSSLRIWQGSAEHRREEVLRTFVIRVGEDLLRVAFLEDATAIEHHHPVGDVLGELHL